MNRKEIETAIGNLNFDYHMNNKDKSAMPALSIAEDIISGFPEDFDFKRDNLDDFIRDLFKVHEENELLKHALKQNREALVSENRRVDALEKAIYESGSILAVYANSVTQQLKEKAEFDNQKTDM